MGSGADTKSINPSQLLRVLDATPSLTQFTMFYGRRIKIRLHTRASVGQRTSFRTKVKCLYRPIVSAGGLW